MAGKKDLPRLSKGDLAGLDKDTVALLLWAQDQGARLRKTKEGHVFVYAPDGVRSTSVAPKGKKQNRGGKNTLANIRNLFKEKS